MWQALCDQVSYQSQGTGIELRWVHDFCHEILLGRLSVGSLRLEVPTAQAGSRTSIRSLPRGAGRPAPGSQLA